MKTLIGHFFNHLWKYKNIMRKTISFLLFSILSLSAFAQWHPVGDNIMTPWAEQVDPENVLPEYPRPQMVRQQWLNLNGLWNYAITPCDATTFKAEGQILVPFAVESALSGVGRRVGDENVLWYEREFTLPSSWKGKDVLLHFGAVDWETNVWVNGEYVGEHKGGYDPFTFNVTPHLRKSGRQTLRVRVYDATDQSFQPRGKQVEVPGLIWYTPVTGIWQTVWMEPVAKSHIEDYYVVSDINAGTMTVTVDVAALHVEDVVKVAVLAGGEGYSAEKPASEVVASAECVNGKAVLNIPEVMPWSPDSPHLYGVKVSVLRGSKIVDSVHGYTAMRSVSQKKDKGLNKYRRIALNDEILFQFGPLDQGWWPDGLYTAPTDEALKFDLLKTKEWGFNMVRKHIKIEPARWYYYCDVLGLLVWQDMPNLADNLMATVATRPEEIGRMQRNKWAQDSFSALGTDCQVPPLWKENWYNEWREIIQDLKCFQSIVVWVPFNEAWGQFDTEEAAAFTKALDPTRLVDAASGGNLRFCGDIIDVHHYPCPAMNAFERKFINVLGEYGGIGYPVEGHLWQKDSNWGYGDVKTSGEQVLDLYEDFAEMLKTFVVNGCSAAVYTQTTDVEIEVNGLMTYDRKVIKVDERHLAEINRSVIASSPK